MENKLFFKIFNNIYLKSIIFKHVKLFNINYFRRFKTIKEIKEYEQRDYLISIEYCGDEILGVGDFPSFALQEIKFTNHFKMDKSNVDITPSMIIPSTVNKITYPINTCNCCSPNDLSSIPSLTSLVRLYSTQPLDSNTLGKSIKKLSFCPFFNQSISSCDQKVLPDGLQVLKFGKFWNNLNLSLSCNDLPSTLTELDLGGYDLEIGVGLIPNTVVKLTMNQHAEKGIPKGVIPLSVKTLCITSDGGNNNGTNQKKKELKNGIFDKVKSKLNRSGDDSTINDKLTTKQQLLNIPNSVTSLEFGPYVCSRIKRGTIPNSCKTLYISSVQNDFIIDQDAITHLPNLVNFIAQYWDQKIEPGFFPPTIQYINLGHVFNQKIVNGILPKSLLLLKISIDYGIPIIEDAFPNGVKIVYNIQNNDYKKLT